MGRGMGRGMGMGMGRGMQAASPVQQAPAADKDSELAALRDALKELRQQLADTMERIEKLEGEES
jgi:hypothetical protein